ncbi:MAG TPA: hypothetical protein VEU97_16815 [Ktedonobacteraceae bacterium]|nr:hypothetical protein [Ktedonobacteraceae bacterium]
MGNQANYVIIENGQSHIFYSRWGALTIPSVLLSGPEGTLEYIRQLSPDEALLDNIWAEGGVLMDVDAHRALFWGGDAIALQPYLRRPLLAALSLLWPGWSIDWALFGVADLARNIGWEISRVLDDEFVDTAFLVGSGAVVTEAQLLESLHANDSEAILTLRWKTGEVKDYLFLLKESFDKPGTHRFLATPYQVLSLGPRLLSILPTESTISLPKEGSGQEPKKGAYVDEEAQTIWIWEGETLDPRYLEAIARRWPGWQVQGHVEGLVRHIILSGRDPAAISVSVQQAIQELIAALTGERGFDPMQLSQVIQQALPPEEQQGMKFGKGFFSTDTPPLARQERRDVLEHLLSGQIENGKTRMAE